MRIKSSSPFEKSLHSAFKVKKRAEWHQKIDYLESKFKVSPITRIQSINFHYLFQWAATITLIILLTYPNDQSNEDVFYSYYYVPIHHNLLRSNTASHLPTSGLKAYQWYDLGKFAEAIPQFRAAFEIDQNKDHLFYMSICYIETHQYELALSTLAPLVKSYPQQVIYRWYHTLLLIKLEKWTSAKEQCQIIMHSKTNYSSQARTLLPILRRKQNHRNITTPKINPTDLPVEIRD